MQTTLCQKTYDFLPVVWPGSVVESVWPEPELRVTVDGVAQDGLGVQRLGVLLDGLGLKLGEGFLTAVHVGAGAEGDTRLC